MNAPSFIERDPDNVTRDLISLYEDLTGKTLYPAQVERLLIDVIAYRESLVREAIQDAACQNLVNFARAPMLDELGALVGCKRLEPTSASTKIQFTLTTPLTYPFLISKNTLIKSNDGKVFFSTVSDCNISKGELTGTVWASCTTEGEVGNGYIAGTLTRLVTPISQISETINITPTSGGSNAEEDDAYRERIKLAPETFSVAGSWQAYRYHAMSAHPDIVDVAVVSPVPGEVKLYPLVEDGLPTENIINAVYEACSDRKVRPLTDYVEVLSPEPINYNIEANVILYTNADKDSTLENIVAAAYLYRDKVASILGQDIVDSQIISALSVPGVYQINLVSPANILVVDDHQWPKCTDIKINFAGVTNG